MNYLCAKHCQYYNDYCPYCGPATVITSSTTTGKIIDQTTSTVSYKGGVPAKCGCTMTTPHSHLVAGHECDCEKGVPELSQ